MEYSKKRKLKRLRSFKGGRIILESQSFTSVECIIKDINSRGARIRVPELTRVDKSLQLIILPENYKVSAICRWQIGREAGLMFVTPIEWFEKHDQPEDRDG